MELANQRAASAFVAHSLLGLEGAANGSRRRCGRVSAFLPSSHQLLRPQWLTMSAAKMCSVPLRLSYSGDPPQEALSTR